MCDTKLAPLYLVPWKNVAQNHQCADSVNKVIVHELDRRPIGELRWSILQWVDYSTLLPLVSKKFVACSQTELFVAQGNVNSGTSRHNVVIASVLSSLICQKEA